MNFNSKKIYQQAKSFLFSNLNKQLFVFLFFLFLSSVFWLSTSLNETYEQEFSVPVQLVDVPEKVVITTDVPDSIRVTLQDKGYTLLTYRRSLQYRPIKLSFKAYATNGTGKGVVPASDIQKQVLRRINTSTEIKLMKPEKIEFEYNFGHSKRVPVRLYGQVLPADNYYLAQTVFSPESVLVYANKPLLDTLTAVYTVAVDLNGFEDTLGVDLQLQQAKGVKTVPQTVYAKFVADILTEQTLEVPIVGINMPSNKTLRTFPNKVKVTFQVGASKIRLVKASQFQVIVDFNEIMQNPSDKCRLRLRSYPNIVSKPRLETSQVDYIIEQR